MKILVVEDTLIAQMVIKSMLTDEGCEVDMAVDGNKALEKANENQYDVILMDIGLGAGPDGFEATANIKSKSKLNKTTPIMAVTSHEQEEYKQKAIKYGMDGYFNKPFTRENVKAVIEYCSANDAKKTFNP